MNIWLITIGETLPLEQNVRKHRTGMLADTLVGRGYTVRWWVSTFEHQRKAMQFAKDREVSLSDGFALQVLRGCGYRKNVSLARYIDHLVVAFKFRVQSKKFPKPDVIVASMPDHLLAYEAARYARKNRIPFIVDIRDLWPDIFLDRFRSMGLYGVGKIALALDFAKLSFLLKNADSLVAVSKGYLKWGLDKIGRPESPFDKMFYLGYKNSNARNQVNKEESLCVPNWLKGREKQKVFVFIGTFGVSYELELILDAAKCFSRSSRTDICFVLAGAGENFDLINKMAAGLQNVVLPGWIGKKEINVLLKIGFAGLLLYVKDAPQGLPNKPFEYLSAGLPLVNSLEGEMAELIDLHGFGLNYLPGDLEGLCQCIERFVDDAKLHDEMSRNASQFFNKYADADKIYDEYSGHIERLVEYKRHTNSKMRS
ncbi:MAG: glycosyltransferase family 4 protein [Candidatus Omnitrophica bacterium]|nr:glycosyltransferase family 4 protein [Candidatus Omnitrophota bacterium]